MYSLLCGHFNQRSIHLDQPIFHHYPIDQDTQANPTPPTPTSSKKWLPQFIISSKDPALHLPSAQLREHCPATLDSHHPPTLLRLVLAPQVVITHYHQRRRRPPSSLSPTPTTTTLLHPSPLSVALTARSLHARESLTHLCERRHLVAHAAQPASQPATVPWTHFAIYAPARSLRPIVSITSAGPGTLATSRP